MLEHLSGRDGLVLSRQGGMDPWSSDPVLATTCWIEGNIIRTRFQDFKIIVQIFLFLIMEIKRDVGVVACGLRRTLDFENYDLYWNEKLLIQCWRIETETITEDHVPNCMMLFLIIHSWSFNTICKALLAKFIYPSKIYPE